VSSEDEIGQLAGYFNRFMSQLEEEHQKRHLAERDRRRMSEQLQQSQKMEAIGQLAGGVAHDFNNILSAIMGSAELLKLQSDKNLHRLIENIIQAASRASDLTRNLLDFSRKGTLQKLPVDMHSMLDEVISLLSHSIDKRIEIIKDFKSQNPIVLGDPSKLQNAFLNLGINARDAMEKGGTIAFSTTDIEIEANTRTRFGDLPIGDYLKISVADTGIGIPKSDIERVMEPFYTTKEQGKGTGLGLASVYGSVLIHDGQIDIHSVPKKGTTFEIYIPTPNLPVQTADDTISSKLIYGTGNIMIVDDEDFVRNYGSSALRKLGYTVFDFSDPLEAVGYFEEHHQAVDLVVLDLIMPKMNGREVLEAMRQIDAEIPVVITSGYGKQQEGDLLKEGARHFIRKPFTLGELSYLVDRYKRSSQSEENIHGYSPIS
jgi:two-component system, cell cycle sensor histidine kinase and response regulator CckA